MDMNTGKIYSEKDVAKMKESMTEEEFEKRFNEVYVLPKRSCKKCYGRGHVGKNLMTGKVVMCTCMKVKKVKKETTK